MFIRILVTCCIRKLVICCIRILGTCLFESSSILSLTGNRHNILAAYKCHITSPGMPASTVKSTKDTWGLTITLPSRAIVQAMLGIFHNCWTSLSVTYPHRTSKAPCSYPTMHNSELVQNWKNISTAKYWLNSWSHQVSYFNTLQRPKHLLCPFRWPTTCTICCIFSLALLVLNAFENHHFKWEELYTCASSAVYLSSVFGARLTLTCRREAPSRDS